MQIEIKKDIEKEYKDELFKGFSIKEAAALGVAALTAMAIVFILWRYFGISIEVGVYFSVPCILPILAMGFFTIQGLSPLGYLREMIYEQKTRILIYDADEIVPSRNVVTRYRRSQKKRWWKIK